MKPESEIGQVHLLSGLAGTLACDARCPYCVAKMTPNHGLELKEPQVHWKRFRQAFEYAREGHANTFMVTSKGESLLFPQHITVLLAAVLVYENETGFHFKKKELQTNGLKIEQRPEKYEPLLATWKELGLQTVIVSFVHFDPEINRQIYLPYDKAYIKLDSLVSRLHKCDLKARLGCIMFNGGIDSPEKFEKLIEFTRQTGADELTARMVNMPEHPENADVARWVSEHRLSDDQLLAIQNYLNNVGLVREQYSFGGTVYDVDGQNVCLTSSLTKSQPGYARQLIFHLNGDIATDWTDDAELLL